MTKEPMIDCERTLARLSTTLNPIEASPMTRSCRTLCVLLGLLAVITAFIVGPTFPSLASSQEKAKDEKPKNAPPPKWEYRVVNLPTTNFDWEKELNKLGDESWEVVGVAGDVSSVGKGQGSAPISTTVKVILKRQK